jgi:hypothetical protein
MPHLQRASLNRESQKAREREAKASVRKWQRSESWDAARAADGGLQIIAEGGFLAYERGRAHVFARKTGLVAERQVAMSL